MSIVAVLTLYVHTGDFPAAQATEEVVMDRAQEIRLFEERAKHYAAVVAGCMNGEVIVWTDPHTKMDMAAKCRVAEIGRMQ